MNWYYADGGRPTGPVEEAALDDLVRTGAVRDDTLVWCEGMAEWQPHATVRGARLAPPMPAASVGAGTPRYAGFWIRFVARVLDQIILSAGEWLLFIPVRPLFQIGAMPANPAAMISLGAGILGLITLLAFIVSFAYEVFFVSTYGGTPGKLILGLRIVRADGSPVSAALACGRYLAYLINTFTLFIGFIMAGFDHQKRALHDRICDTRVIHAN